jgi:diaminobutyrate-2-oxoglutarate transaminase
LTETVRRQPLREASARTYARALPIVPVRARGMTVEGADGRRYLDCLSGDGALALGHNHPVVLAAVREVLDSGAPIGVLDLSTPVEERFVAELLATLPPEQARGARIRFCGPTAADAMAVASRLVTGATGVAGPLIPADPPGEGHERAEAPGKGHESAEALLERCAAGGGRPAGVVVEPLRDERLRRLREVTRAHGVPLVVDETVTGVGRTGAFWAVEHSGVTPDVMVLAKAIGGSLPLAVVVHRGDLGAPASSAGFGGVPAAAGASVVRAAGAEVTEVARGNQLAMAAGAATLAHVREHRLAERAAAVGDRMLIRLRELAARFACVAGVHGRGLMLGLEFAHPDPGRVHGEPCGAPGLAAAVRRECLRRGLIVGLGGGPHAEVVRLLPPLTVSDGQADAVLERLADAVEAAAGGADRP